MANLVVGTPKVQSEELEIWHATNPVEELFYSQKEIARFLEVGYLALRDHPEVAAEIRNTAHKSRTQHVLTAGLFKKFVVTASNVVNTYCPMMMDALELQEIEILKEAFEQVLEMCLDMKKETEDSRNSYLAIQEKVQQNLNTVNITNSKIKSEVEIIEQTKKSELAQLKEAKRQQEELETEKEKLKERVERITNNQDEWLEKSAPPSGLEEFVETFIDVAMIPTGAMVAGPFGAIVGAVTFGGNVIRKMEKAKQALIASQEAEKQAQTVYEEKRKVTETVHERKKQTLQKIAHIEALTLRKSSFGDIKSLQEAITQLGNVDKQFMRIIMFWDSMATMLKHLHQNQKAGGVYLKKIEDAKYAEKFQSSINRAEMTWNRIGMVCQNYVQVNDEVIMNVYGFLSAPVDNMSDEEVKKRKESLIRKIKDEAEQLDDVE